MHDEFAIPRGIEWDYAKDARPQQKADHFDCDRKPVEDLTKNEVLGIARYEASVSKRDALACQWHLRDLLKWHGKGHL